MSWRREIRAQLELAFPVVLVQLGLMAMGAVDVAFMGRVSSEALAAVALGHVWTFGFICFGMGVLTALDPIVSQAFGAKDEVAVRRGLQRGILLALVLSVPIALAIAPAEPVLRFFAQPEEILATTATYSHISILGVPAFLLFVTLRTTLQAMHLLRPLVIVIVATNLLNVLLDYALVFGNFGFEPMGAAGSAWATAISRWALTILLVVLAWPVLRPYLSVWDAATLRLTALGRVLRLGLPIGIQFTAEVGAFHVIALLMGNLGKVELAGHQVALTLASVSFMVPLGISIAASVRVGNAIGREDPTAARKAAKVAMGLGVGVMLFFGTLFLTLPELLASLLTDKADVLAVAAVLLPMAGLFQVFDGVQVVSTGVLRGAADTRVPMMIHFAGFWFVGVPLAVWLAHGLDQGPIGLWWGLVAGLGAVAVVQALRLRYRLSASLDRVAIEDSYPSVP